MEKKSWIEIVELDYGGICEYFAKRYMKEFGERKFSKILNKVNDSGKVKKLIDISSSKGIKPNYIDFMQTILSIPYFMVSNSKTKSIAGIIAIQRWNLEVNSVRNLATRDELKMTVLKLIREA